MPEQTGSVIRPLVGQGPAKLANDEDLQRDNVGFTHPNLHRRVDPQSPEPDSDEVAPRDYMFAIQSTDSYRTTEIITHDEESVTSEIP